MVEVTPADWDRCLGHESAEGEHADLGRAGTDVHHHRGDRLLYPQPGAERHCDLLLHEANCPRARLLESSVEGSPLDTCRRARRAAQHRRLTDRPGPHEAQQLPRHRPGEVEIGQLAMADRPNDRHLPGAASAQAEGFGPECQETVPPEVDRGNRRLVDDDPATGDSHECACGPEVDCEIGAHYRSTFGGCSMGRDARLQSVPPSKVSRFQIGTVAFKVSITKRQASKASARCGVETTTTTEASPSSM